jgi:hypothetical protein
MTVAELQRENELLMDKLIQLCREEIDDNKRMIVETERLIQSLTRGEECARVQSRVSPVG